jgi:type IV pilus assembly protein PilB
VDSPPTQPGRKRRLGEILIAAGLLDELQLKAALSEQRKWGGKLGRTLVEMGFVDETSMVFALSKQLHLPLVDLDKTQLAQEVVQHLRVDMAERYGVFPVGADPIHRTLQLATSDPTNGDAMKELAFHTGMRIQPQVATGSSIDRAIRHYYYGDAVAGVPGAAPRATQLSETTFEPEQLGPPASATSGSADVARMAEQIASLEKLVAGQVRAMRGMLEILVEKGVVSREEYLAKIRILGD